MNCPKHSAISSGRKRAAGVSIESGVIDAAKQLGINISQIAEAYVEEHGLPLAKYRMF